MRQPNLFRELAIDNFAGGGGASSGIKLAIGRDVDVAINHDDEAVLMHMANHPKTKHYCEDVWDVDPRKAVGGQPVGIAWFSPDCKHFSKAKGGKPVSKRVRGLAWLAVKWARAVRPRLIFLENVEEFVTWGPLGEDSRPCPKRKGQTFARWVNTLKGLGYQVAWRELRACDYGAPTSRKRLFLVARCDGKPIQWPKPTHGKGKGLKPYRTAADCIDWSLPCPSIFDRSRPLAENTLRRIARGVMRYVVNSPAPFVVPNSQGYAVPYLVPRYGEREGQEPRTRSVLEPAPTIVPTGNHGALVAAFLAKHNGIGDKQVVGQGLDEPMHTVTAVDTKAVVAASILKLRGTSTGQPANDPLHTVSAQGTHFAEVRAFLIKYFGTDQNPQLEAPLHTVTTKERFALIVTIHGEQYEIVDIGMRMLTPRELFRAQGFPDDYVIGDDPSKGLILTKAAQVRMCGNSVCPPMSAALVKANYADAIKRELAA